MFKSAGLLPPLALLFLVAPAMAMPYPPGAIERKQRYGCEATLKPRNTVQPTDTVPEGSVLAEIRVTYLLGAQRVITKKFVNNRYHEYGTLVSKGTEVESFLVHLPLSVLETLAGSGGHISRENESWSGALLSDEGLIAWVLLTSFPKQDGAMVFSDASNAADVSERRDAWMELIKNMRWGSKHADSTWLYYTRTSGPLVKNKSPHLWVQLCFRHDGADYLVMISPEQVHSVFESLRK